MKKSLIAITLLLAGFGPAAADSYSFTYQACLRDEKGAIIKDGGGNVRQNHQVEVRLYNAATGGTALWGRTYNVLTDSEGLFNLAVSDAEGSQLVNATLESVLKRATPGGLFLGLTVVGSSGEIVPRQCLFATPFAAVANDVRAVSGDLAVGGVIRLGSGNQEVVVSKSGITQKGGSTTVQKLAVNESASVAGALTAGGGVLTADGNGVTVQGRPLNVKNTQLTVNGSEVVPVPIGGIIMWTQPNPPDYTHWAVCNGQTVNGVKTPDLRDRFIVAAGGSYSGGATGGANTVTLTADQMPVHSHKFDDWDWQGYDDGRARLSEVMSPNGYGWKDGHALETKSAGGNQAHENRPPYYALYYIMRVK